MHWSPIFLSSDNTMIQAREAVDAIAHAVMSKDHEETTQEAFLPCTYEAALLYGYLAVTRNDYAWAARATECINCAIDEVPKQRRHLDLFGGLTGLGWTVEHLSQLLNQTSFAADDCLNTNPPYEAGLASEEPAIDEDLNAEIDTAILSNLRHYNSSRPYDLISGLVGFGVYFLERVPKRTAIQGVREVFARVEALAEHNRDGVAWYSGPDLLPELEQKLCPNGYYNLGVAHGIPGIIHFLSEVWATGIVEKQRSHRLLEGAVNWLIAQRRPAGSRSIFGSWIVPGERQSDSRQAWCYGDMGILAILVQVARRTDREDWHKFANELLDHCLDWPLEVSGIRDAPLCHGAIGIAHIFNRLYQSENNPRCGEAALIWFERALGMRQHSSRAGGFFRLRPNPNVWEANPRLLDGAIGVALALISAMTSVEPAWDRMLLLSGRSSTTQLG
jgi:lantibiotic biosynthesis protein